MSPVVFSLNFPTNDQVPVVHHRFLGAGTLAHKLCAAMTSTKFRLIAAGLTLARRPRLVAAFEEGRRTFTMYETPAMDFDLRFTAAAARALASRLDPAEAAGLVWEAPTDDWAAYLTPYFSGLCTRFLGMDMGDKGM